MSLARRELRTALALLAPLVLVMGAFILVPVMGTILESFFLNVSFLKRKFIGLGNYTVLLSDPGFWNAVRFTLKFVAVSVPLEIAMGLGFALVLHESSPLRNLLRVCVLIPWAIPNAISARLWELIYNFHYGLANFVVTKTGLLSPLHWLGSPDHAFAALVLADAWKTAPFVAILVLAGLQAIPSELYDQAKIDRADLYQRFFYVTLPLLRPVLVVALLFRTIDALRVFDLIYVLTGGGPGGSTHSVSLYGYQYFLNADFGYGSAVSVVLFAVAFSLCLIYLKLGRFGETLHDS